MKSATIYLCSLALLVTVGFTEATSIISCETMKSELEKKTEAYETVCSSGNMLPADCCKKLASQVEQYRNDYTSFCTSPKPALRFKGSNTQDYVISTGAPAMKAITVCFWIKTTQSSDAGTYVSYAVERHDNEFLIENYEDGLTTWFFQSWLKRPYKKTSPGIKINDGKWHHICVTWKSQGGAYQIYKDGAIATQGSIAGTVGKTIQSGGTWVLGQDQDKVGGGFQAHQALQGEMAYCNVWSYVLPSTEILEMSKSCKGFVKGNVKTWDDFLSGIKGNVESIKATCS